MKIIINVNTQPFEQCDCTPESLKAWLTSKIIEALSYHANDHIVNIEVE